MDFNRRQITKGLAAGLATSTALTQFPRAAFADKKLRVAMVVKVLGINYFDVGRDGGQEAAKAWRCRAYLRGPDGRDRRAADRCHRYADRTACRRFAHLRQ